MSLAVLDKYWHIWWKFPDENTRKHSICNLTLYARINLQLRNSFVSCFKLDVSFRRRKLTVLDLYIANLFLRTSVRVARWPSRHLAPFSRDFSLNESRRNAACHHGLAGVTSGGVEEARKGWTKGRKRGLGACALTQQYGEFCEVAQYPPDHQLINILPHTRHVIRATHACHASCEPLRV